MTSLAAIDVGSNAIRLVVAETNGKGGYTVLETSREAIRLGKDVFSEGHVFDETVQRAQEAFRRFRKIMNNYKVKTYRAVGTSALREAYNERAVISAISDVSDIDISLIQGEEEARLVCLAVAQKVDLRKKEALLIDIGGGSIEISVLSDGDIVATDSVNMGTVRLLQILEEKKRGAKIFNRLVREYAEGLRRQVKKEIGKHALNLCVGTGGNVECLGSLRNHFFGESDDSRLTAKEIAKLAEELQSLSYEERMSKLSLKADRADVIVPAAIMLQQIVEQAGIQEVVIPYVGLKEGLIYDQINELRGEKGVTPRRRQLLNFAKELGGKYGYDEQHGLAVARFAVELFEQTREMHKLGEQERMLLELAALLHDVGQFVNTDSHHKHSYYLLKSSNFVGLNNRQRNIMACVARYHRKAYPKMEHSAFSELSSEDRQVVNKLSAILRIAEAIDREHSGRVKSLQVNAKKSKIELELVGEGDMLLEKWAIKSRAGLFEKVFDVKFQLAD